MSSPTLEFYRVIVAACERFAYATGHPPLTPGKDWPVEMEACVMAVAEQLSHEWGHAAVEEVARLMRERQERRT